MKWLSDDSIHSSAASRLKIRVAKTVVFGETPLQHGGCHE